MAGAARQPQCDPAHSRVHLKVANYQRRCRINIALFERMARALVQDRLQVNSCFLDVHVVNAREIARLNQTFLRHGGATDVVAFDYRDALGIPGSDQGPKCAGASVLHGEIFICIEEALAQARRFNTTWQAELVRYFIHGALHLLGHRDQTSHQRRQMKKHQDRLLRWLRARFSLSRLG